MSDAWHTWFKAVEVVERGLWRKQGITVDLKVTGAKMVNGND